MPLTATKKIAAQGAAWTVFGYGFSQGVRLVGNLVLTRLLLPELFGLMALIQTFITGLNLFSDVGIGPSIIQNKRGEDPEFYNTAWTLQVIRGFGLWLCCLIIAWPIAKVYDNSQLLWLIPVVGLTTILSGFNSTALFVLNRRIALGKLTIFELGIQFISLTVMIVWAALSPTIWALVGGSLVSAFLKMTYSHWLIPEQHNYLTWNKQASRELFSFGRWIFVSTAMAFLAGQADRLILGKLVSLELLGVYTIAFMFADLPRQVVGRLGSKLIFPLVSQHTNLPRSSLRAKILPKRRLMLLGLACLLTVLVSFGDVIIRILYDDRYDQASWMLPVLAIGIWPIALFQSINPSLLAIGKPFYGACGNSLKLVYMMIGLPIAFSLMGVLGAILVIAFNDLPLYGAVTYGMWREKLAVIEQDIQISLLLIILISLVCTGRYLLGFGFPLEEIL
jgi:O-antigen/teichoic acid export membrane protein